MVEEARAIPGLLSSLILEPYPQIIELLSEWKPSVRDWALRCRYVESVAAAIMKLMALSAMKSK
jgi:hypothetical protein